MQKDKEIIWFDKCCLPLSWIGSAAFSIWVSWVWPETIKPNASNQSVHEEVEEKSGETLKHTHTHHMNRYWTVGYHDLESHRPSPRGFLGFHLNQSQKFQINPLTNKINKQTNTRRENPDMSAEATEESRKKSRVLEFPDLEVRLILLSRAFADKKLPLLFDLW